MSVEAPVAPADAAEITKTEPPPEAIALPMIDGQGVDRIEVAFAGSVRLDRSDPADCELMRQLRLGKEITLRVVGKVAGKPYTVAWDEDGYPGEVTSVAKLRVTTLYRPVGDGTEARVGQAQLDTDGLDDND